MTAVTPKMSNPKPKWAQVRPINLEFNMSERFKPSIIVSWDLKEEINSKTLLKQIHTARKSPINVKRLKSFHMNVQADKLVEIKKRMRNPGSENSIGERVDFVIVEGPPNSKMAELAEDPEYVKNNNLKLDYEWYCEHQVKEPVTRLFGPIKNIPCDLFKRYIGELKRVRLNITSLDSFASELQHETVFIPKLKNTTKQEKRKISENKQTSIFDYGVSENNTESEIKVPKLSAVEKHAPKKRSKKN